MVDAKSNIKLVPLDITKHFDAYARFAKQMFGEGSYQVKKNYVDWILGNGQVILAIEDCSGCIVGCIHGIYEKIDINGHIVSTNVLLNLIVLSAYRKGIGAELIFKVFNRKECAFVLGTSGKLGKAYKKLGMRQVPTFNYRKIYRPIFGSIKFINYKLFGINFGAKSFVNIRIPSPNLKEIYLELCPKDELISKLVRLANLKSIGVVAQHWETDFFKWRFFHSKGPKHLLIYLGQRNEPTDYVILSLGQVKGMHVLRVVFMVIKSSDALLKFMNFIDIFAKKTKADILIIMHTSSELASYYCDIGWETVKPRMATYIYLVDKKKSINETHFFSAAGDSGFEAIL